MNEKNIFVILPVNQMEKSSNGKKHGIYSSSSGEQRAKHENKNKKIVCILSKKDNKIKFHKSTYLLAVIASFIFETIFYVWYLRAKSS